MYMNRMSDRTFIVTVEEKIGACDFMTSRSKIDAEADSPWIITVGEHNWRRHLLVKEPVVGDDIVLTILSVWQSERSGVDVDITDVDRDVNLSELIADTYQSVKSMLRPTSAAA